MSCRPIAARAVSRRRFRARFRACRTASRRACAACNSATICAVRFSVQPERPACCSGLQPQTDMCGYERAPKRSRGSHSSKSHTQPRAARIRFVSASDAWSLSSFIQTHCALTWLQQEISHDSNRCANAAPVPARRVTLRRLGISVSLAACAASIFPFIPDHYTFSQQQVQEAVQRKFPFQRTVSQVFDVALTNPVVGFLPDRESRVGEARCAAGEPVHAASGQRRLHAVEPACLRCASTFGRAEVADVDNVSVSGRARRPTRSRSMRPRPCSPRSC